MTAPGADLLAREFQEINAHLRANMSQFVNWFSFFLTFSFVAAAGFVGATRRPDLHVPALIYGVQVVFLLMHILAFFGILTFRRYMGTSHRRLEQIVDQLDPAAKSPVPLRFCQWMTDLMAAGYVVSYFTWLSLLLLG